jgi:translation initiation factor eIF-2B subunit epsilon
MGGQKTRKVSSDSKSNNDAKSEIRQAILLADSFESRFVPLTLTVPRCLLPLANVPLIEYALDALWNSKIQEVFIYCRNHVSQIHEYLK